MSEPLTATLTCAELTKIRQALQTGAEYIDETAAQYKADFGLGRSYHITAYHRMLDDLRQINEWIDKLEPLSNALKRG